MKFTRKIRILGVNRQVQLPTGRNAMNKRKCRNSETSGDRKGAGETSRFDRKAVVCNGAQRPSSHPQ